MTKFETEIDDLAVEITYSVIGHYRMATMEDPAEFPEIDIQEIKLLGDFIEENKAAIIESFDLDKIETLCWENEESFSDMYHQPEPIN